MRGFASEFLRRRWFAHHIGSIRTMNGRYYSLPLYHRRPPEGFKSRLTRLEKIELDAWLERTPVV